MRTIISFFVLFLADVSYASQTINFHETGDNTFVVELISSTDIGEEKGLEVIANASIKKCENKPAHFGRYRFVGQEQISTKDIQSEYRFRMIQQLFCGQLPTLTQKATQPLSNKEKTRLESQAIKLTDDYLDYLAKYDFKKAYSLHSRANKEDRNYKDWEKSQKQQENQPGDLLRGETWRITTYIDPPSSPRKGVYIATDFDREYTKYPIFCGYLVWYLEGDKLKVTREDIGKVNSDQFSKIRAEDLMAIKSKLGCKPLTSNGSG